MRNKIENTGGKNTYYHNLSHVYVRSYRYRHTDMLKNGSLSSIQVPNLKSAKTIYRPDPWGLQNLPSLPGHPQDPSYAANFT